MTVHRHGIGGKAPVIDFQRCDFVALHLAVAVGMTNPDARRGVGIDLYRDRLADADVVHVGDAVAAAAVTGDGVADVVVASHGALLRLAGKQQAADFQRRAGNQLLRGYLAPRREAGHAVAAVDVRRLIVALPALAGGVELLNALDVGKSEAALEVGLDEVVVLFDAAFGAAVAFDVGMMLNAEPFQQGKDER